MYDWTTRLELQISQVLLSVPFKMVVVFSSSPQSPPQFSYDHLLGLLWYSTSPNPHYHSVIAFWLMSLFIYSLHKTILWGTLSLYNLFPQHANHFQPHRPPRPPSIRRGVPKAGVICVSCLCPGTRSGSYFGAVSWLTEGWIFPPLVMLVLYFHTVLNCFASGEKLQMYDFLKRGRLGLNHRVALATREVETERWRRVFREWGVVRVDTTRHTCTKAWRWGSRESSVSAASHTRENDRSWLDRPGWNHRSLVRIF